MRSKTLNKDEICVDNSAFHRNKSSIKINEININRMVLLNKTSYGNKGSFKYYIGYRHNDGNFSPLSGTLPQLTGYAKHFNNGAKHINFLVADKKLLRKYNEYGLILKAYLKKNLIKNSV